jgi:hypothetical protein
MNVTGVGATPPAPQPPPVSPVVRSAGADEPGVRGSGTGERGRRVPERSESEEARPSAPPLRVLTVTEMRVMLGQLPPSAAVHEKQHGPADVGKAYG